MRREVCMHGVPVDSRPPNDCEWCAKLREQFANDVKNRRAQWIRNNVALLWMGGNLEYTQRAVDGAEKMADELIRRGYL